MSTFGDVKGMVRGLSARLQDLLVDLDGLLEGFDARRGDSMGVMSMAGVLARGLELWDRPATRFGRTVDRLVGRPAD
jgi:hypothetical protein